MKPTTGGSTATHAGAWTDKDQAAAVVCVLASLLLSPTVLITAAIVAVATAMLLRRVHLRAWGAVAFGLALGAPLLIATDAMTGALHTVVGDWLHGHPITGLREDPTSWLLAAVGFGLPVGGFGGVLLTLRWARLEMESGSRRATPRARTSATGRARAVRRATTADQDAGILGADDHNAPLVLDWELLRMHTLVLGATGAGKTTTLVSLAAQSVQAGLATMLVDLKGDPALVSELTAYANAFGRRAHVFSLDGHSDRWNPLAHGTATELKDKLVGMEQWNEPHYKRAAERHLQLVFTVLEHTHHDTKPTLADVVELLTPSQLNAAIRELPEDLADRVSRYLDALTRDQQSAIGGLANRLALITESVAGTHLEDPTGAGIDLARSLADSDLVIFSLNSSVYGELAAQVGGLVLQDLKAVAGRRVGTDQKTAMVIIDEASALDGDHVLSLVARGRASKLAIVLATQELADFDRVATGYRDQILGNTATKLCHRQDNPESAELLASIMGTELGWEQTQQIDLYSLLGASPTGVGTRRMVDRFVIHPNEFKNLRIGEAILMTKVPDPRAARIDIIPAAEVFAAEQRARASRRRFRGRQPRSA